MQLNLNLVIAIVVVAGVLLMLLASLYNSFIGLRNQIRNAWSQVDVQLKRRYDLVPNLVEAVRGYMKHEHDTLTDVTAARSRAMAAGGGAAEKGAVEKILSDAMAKIYVAVEKYPELKANANFMALYEELRSTENKIAFARQHYNDNVMFYNNQTQMFPTNVMAVLFRFTPEPFFQLEDKTQAVLPPVKF